MFDRAVRHSEYLFAINDAETILNLWDALIVLVFSLVGLWIAGTAAPTRSMRAMFVAYLALNLFAFLLKGPIGSNPSRLFAIAGAPMLWLTANLNPRRSRLLVEAAGAFRR